MEEGIRPGYTRVSEVLAVHAGYHHIPKYIMQQACERGTLVHSVIESMMLDIGTPSLPSHIEGYVSSFCKWYETHGDSVFLMPNRWYMEDLKITGKCDCIVQKDGRSLVVDFKTSQQENKVWRLQGSAYKRLAESSGLKIDQIVFVKLSKEGLFPLELFYEDEFEYFKQCLSLYRYFHE